MSGLTRQLSGQAATLQRDVTAALERTRAAAESAAESYEPADPSSWASPPPTTQDEALDRLAAQLAALGGVPVP